MKILDFIEKDGEGKYSCYKTKKLILDPNDQDTLDYDDKPAVQIRAPLPFCPEVTQTPLFSFFLDGSRHVYKVDDIAIGNRIFPFLAGQIVVGCCVRKDRDTFKCHSVTRKVLLSLPRNFNYDDDKEANFCRMYCEKINEELEKNIFVQEHGIKIDKILLYPTDGSKDITADKNGYKNSGTAKIQNEMTDEEQLMKGFQRASPFKNHCKFETL